jgi:hypothetical protein
MQEYQVSGPFAVYFQFFFEFYAIRNREKLMTLKTHYMRPPQSLKHMILLHCMMSDTYCAHNSFYISSVLDIWLTE